VQVAPLAEQMVHYDLFISPVWLGGSGMIETLAIPNGGSAKNGRYGASTRTNSKETPCHVLTTYL